MKRMIAVAATALLAAGFSSAAPAANLMALTVTASSSNYTGDLGVLVDYSYTAQGANYCTAGLTVCNFEDTTFTFDFGGTYHVSDWFAGVDNNDDYVVEFFNGDTSVGMITILASEGSVEPFPGGMDNFSTLSFPETNFHGPVLNFDATKAVMKGVNGDGLYGISELALWGTPAPEPASWAMMIAGFALVGGTMRSRKRAVRFA